MHWSLKNKINVVKGFIYKRQVKLSIPLDVIERNQRNLPSPPEGYTVRSPKPGENLKSWAMLLNKDGQFGTWTEERVQSEIISKLIHPDAATLAFYGDELIGCASAQETKLRRRRIGLGMFLYIDRGHRGKNLAQIIIYRTLRYFLGEVSMVVATTDPTRFSALAIYLADGWVPLHDSLFSFFQWRGIHKRLNRSIEALKRKASRNREK